MLRVLIILLVLFPSKAFAVCIYDGREKSAIAMFGEPKYEIAFKYFDYVNAKAPKGGDVKFAEVGTFDNLNPYILKGVAASGMGYIYDTLMVASMDEPFSKYPLVAKTIKVARDCGSVEFELDKDARFHDGSPITPEDVIFSFDILTTKGHPFYRSYYGDVEEAIKVSNSRVRFVLKNKDNRELPMILADLPILSKKYYEENEFNKTTLEPPLGSGPYKIAGVDSGKWIKYQRVEDYWAHDLPVNRGRYNFGSITYDYYRDEAVAIEAFKAGEYDMRRENISKVWNNAYNIDAVKDGRIIKEEIRHEQPTGMQGFVFNMRKNKFKDRKVREALNYAFDFEWENKNLFYSTYTRTQSYFSNSEMASKGLPEGLELKMLEEYKDILPEDVFKKEYKAPETDGSGNNRDNLLIARDMLSDAGWVIKNGVLTNIETGEEMEIEFMLSSPTFERVIAPIIRNLKKLGIKGSMRTVDSAQYIKRMESFDFDMMVSVFGQSNSPGNEQMDYWHSSRADIKGSRNLAGIKNKAVDGLIEKIIGARSKNELVASTRALDRVLLHNHYLIPNFHSRYFRVVRWNKFGLPKKMPKYDLGIDNWWIEFN